MRHRDKRPAASGADNIDADVVRGFGEEWTRFDQAELTEAESLEVFHLYFEGFPWDKLSPQARGFDLGCGSGRWARHAAEKVGSLVCIDPSEAALAVAKRRLAQSPSVEFVHAGAGSLPIESERFDFGYCLGVLHHTPDPGAGLRDAVRTLRPGAPMLVYLYYALDNRPLWFRSLWRATDLPRRVISRLPMRVRAVVCDLIAATVYLPIARATQLVERFGFQVDGVPLAAYRRRSFYVMRTDALDRFGTRLEIRFTREETAKLLTDSGLISVEVRDAAPYWRAIGLKPGTAVDRPPTSTFAIDTQAEQAGATVADSAASIQTST